MVQEIIALLIVAVAVAYTAYSIYKTLTAPKNSDCDTVCGGCSIKHDLKKQIEYNKMHPVVKL